MECRRRVAEFQWRLQEALSRLDGLIIEEETMDFRDCIRQDLRQEALQEAQPLYQEYLPTEADRIAHQLDLRIPFLGQRPQGKWALALQNLVRREVWLDESYRALRWYAAQVCPWRAEDDPWGTDAYADPGLLWDALNEDEELGSPEEQRFWDIRDAREDLLELTGFHELAADLTYLAGMEWELEQDYQHLFNSIFQQPRLLQEDSCRSPLLQPYAHEVSDRSLGDELPRETPAEVPAAEQGEADHCLMDMELPAEEPTAGQCSTRHCPPSPDVPAEAPAAGQCVSDHCPREEERLADEPAAGSCTMLHCPASSEDLAEAPAAGQCVSDHCPREKNHLAEEPAAGQCTPMHCPPSPEDLAEAPAAEQCVSNHCPMEGNRPAGEPAAGECASGHYLTDPQEPSEEPTAELGAARLYPVYPEDPTEVRSEPVLVPTPLVSPQDQQPFGQPWADPTGSSRVCRSGRGELCDVAVSRQSKSPQKELIITEGCPLDFGLQCGTPAPVPLPPFNPPETARGTAVLSRQLAAPTPGAFPASLLVDHKSQEDASWPADSTSGEVGSEPRTSSPAHPWTVPAGCKWTGTNLLFVPELLEPHFGLPPCLHPGTAMEVSSPLCNCRQLPPPPFKPPRSQTLGPSELPFGRIVPHRGKRDPNPELSRRPLSGPGRRAVM